MSSTPFRNSLGLLAGALKARSKLSMAGRNALMASATAKSRYSWCSLAARLRAFSNSACERASRSSSVSRSDRIFCNSLASGAGALDSAPVPFLASSVSSEAGNSCSRSSSCGSTCDFPFVFAIKLFRFVENFVKEARNIGNCCHRVLVVNTRRPNHGQRSPHFTAHPGRRADEHKIAHRGQRLIQTDHNAHRFLLRVQISLEQPDDLPFLL